eukprot:SAG25_NODE_412_length_8295_cov_17.983895_10_plen_43_part_01
MPAPDRATQLKHGLDHVLDTYGIPLLHMSGELIDRKYRIVRER